MYIYTYNFLVLQISAWSWKVKNSCLLRGESPVSHKNAVCGFMVYKTACGEVCWEPPAPFQNHVVILCHDVLLSRMIKHTPVYIQQTQHHKPVLNVSSCKIPYTSSKINCSQWLDCHLITGDSLKMVSKRSWFWMALIHSWFHVPITNLQLHPSGCDLNYGNGMPSQSWRQDSPITNGLG